MTQDELWAALLLFGFKTSRKTSTRDNTLAYLTRDKWVLVRFNTKPNKIGIKYREAGKQDAWRDFNATPESAFNFIKKRFL